VPEGSTVESGGGVVTRSTTMTYTVMDGAAPFLDDDSGTASREVEAGKVREKAEEELQLVSQMEGGSTIMSASMSLQKLDGETDKTDLE
jgi:hypothetical protein